MSYKLELKPYIPQEKQKCIVLQLTDIQLHTRSMPQSSIGKNFKKSIETNTPGRVYSPIKNPQVDDNNFKLTILDFAKNYPELSKAIFDYQNQGYKVLIKFPKDGLPVFAGKDTVEFIKSKNGQRIVRGLAKDKPTD